MADLKIVGLGGSLRVASRRRAALAVALDGAAAAGVTVELLDLRRLDIPMFNPDEEQDPPPLVRSVIETCYEADGMLWSSPMYNGSASGSFKNAIDWLHILGSREPAYLHDKVVGLISTAGGMQGLQVINTMEFSVRSLRAWAVPLAVPVPRATNAFADSGEVQDETIELQLRTLGAEVVRVTQRLRAIRRCTGRPNVDARPNAWPRPASAVAYSAIPAGRQSVRTPAASRRPGPLPAPAERTAWSSREGPRTALPRALSAQR
jgi:FMN reductase